MIDSLSKIQDNGWNPTDNSSRYAVQEALKLLGHYSGEPNGVNDSKAKEATKSFQKQERIVDDGAVGPKTIDKLITALGKIDDQSQSPQAFTVSERFDNSVTASSALQLAEVTPTLELPQDVEFFRADDGSMIAEWSYGGMLLFSKDGKTFYQVKSTGFGGTDEEHNMSFDNPHDGTSGRYRREGNVIDLNGKTFDKASRPKNASMVSLPEVRENVYSFRLADGKELIVTDDKYSDSYESFKMTIGGKNVPILNVIRYRDGGTTIITTPEGELFVPAPHKNDKKPTWKGQVISR